uniref:Uncharacterized protein n=1 Tax=Tetranychus urticae TaxID=32264 RepID=T1JY08_TETUR
MLFFCLIKVLFDGLMLTAIILQWRLYLRICRFIMCFVAAAMTGAVEGKKTNFVMYMEKVADFDKHVEIVFWVFYLIYIGISFISAKLIGKYTGQLRRARKKPVNPAPESTAAKKSNIEVKDEDHFRLGHISFP